MHLYTTNKLIVQSLKTKNTALIAKFARDTGVSFKRASFIIEQEIMLNKLKDKGDLK